MAKAAAVQAKILVVDDDKLIRTVLSDLLGDDYEVITAANGSEALKALQKHDVAAVLCDQMMPDIEGVKVLEQCINLRPEAVRVLITASDDVRAARDAVNLARVHRFIVKPLHELEVVSLVRGAVRERELESENRRLVSELRTAVEQLQEREKELERELNVRTRELKEVVDRLLAKRSGG
jgi:response regulator RpfG family c-di-GMP phosphodiesterase